MTPVITNADIITPYGHGLTDCWQGLMSGSPTFTPLASFSTDFSAAKRVALAPALDPGERSRLLSLLRPVLRKIIPALPADAAVLLATTTGEVVRMEQCLINHTDPKDVADPMHLLNWIREQTGVTGPGSVISAACASSSTALARAADMIQAEEAEAVLVVGGDAVSEFVLAGFATLMALASEGARPFDRERDGLTVGEAGTAALIMHPARACRESREIIGSIRGWGLASDANHMTGPSRDGSGLAEAVTRSLHKAKLNPTDIRSVCAHGTGTVYNDAMEIKAFQSVFGDQTVPVYSVKGGTGHTMGAAGLLEALIANHSLSQPEVPPSVGLQEPDSEARQWVSSLPRRTDPRKKAVMSTNSGFGGVNSSVILGQ